MHGSSTELTGHSRPLIHCAVHPHARHLPFWINKMHCSGPEGHMTYACMAAVLQSQAIMFIDSLCTSSACMSFPVYDQLDALQRS